MIFKSSLRALCVLCGSLLFQLSSVPAAEPANTKLDLTFTDINGRQIRPGANSKAVALIFTLPDCPIANSCIPEINRLHDAFASRGVTLLLVHADSETTADKARQHAREYQIKPPVILDPKHHWVKQAAATTSPETVVFSPQGEIVYRGRINDQYVGLGQRRAVVTSHDLRDALEAILINRPIVQRQTEPVGCPIPSLSIIK